MITFEEKRYPSRPDYLCHGFGGKHVGTIFWDGCLESGEYWFEPNSSDYNYISQRAMSEILDKMRQLNMNKGEWS